MPWPQYKQTRKPRRSAEVIELDNLKRRTLIARAKAGDEKALIEYRQLNRGLEESIIGRYARWVSPTDIDDMRQEGFFGLLKGIEAYQLDKLAISGKPEGYIYSWVRAYVCSYARAHGTGSKEQEVTHDPFHGKDGSGDEEEDILSRIPCEEANPEEKHISKDLLEKIQSLLKTLSPKERTILERRFLTNDPETLSAIGDDLGVSRERVRQIETIVREKLLKRVAKQLQIG